MPTEEDHSKLTRLPNGGILGIAGHSREGFSAYASLTDVLAEQLRPAMVAGQYFVARKLFPRHRKLAHLITVADVSITAPFAVRNLYMPLCASEYIDTTHGCQAP